MTDDEELAVDDTKEKKREIMRIAGYAVTALLAAGGIVFSVVFGVKMLALGDEKSGELFDLIGYMIIFGGILLTAAVTFFLASHIRYMEHMTDLLDFLIVIQRRFYTRNVADLELIYGEEKTRNNIELKKMKDKHY